MLTIMRKTKTQIPINIMLDDKNDDDTIGYVNEEMKLWIKGR